MQILQRRLAGSPQPHIMLSGASSASLFPLLSSFSPSALSASPLFSSTTMADHPPSGISIIDKDGFPLDPFHFLRFDTGFRALMPFLLDDKAFKQAEADDPDSIPTYFYNALPALVSYLLPHTSSLLPTACPAKTLRRVVSKRSRPADNRPEAPLPASTIPSSHSQIQVLDLRSSVARQNRGHRRGTFLLHHFPFRFFQAKRAQRYPLPVDWEMPSAKSFWHTTAGKTHSSKKPRLDDPVSLEKVGPPRKAKPSTSKDTTSSKHPSPSKDSGSAKKSVKISFPPKVTPSFSVEVPRLKDILQAEPSTHASKPRPTESPTSSRPAPRPVKATHSHQPAKAAPKTSSTSAPASTKTRSILVAPKAPQQHRQTTPAFRSGQIRRSRSSSVEQGGPSATSLGKRRAVRSPSSSGSEFEPVSRKDVRDDNSSADERPDEHEVETGPVDQPEPLPVSPFLA